MVLSMEERIFLVEHVSVRTVNTLKKGSKSCSKGLPQLNYLIEIRYAL